MEPSRTAWRNTTHDWAADVDLGHLTRIRENPAEFAPGGVLHLILETIAYPADEAASTGGGRCTVTLHADGSVSVADQGRGTDTRLDERGRPVRKPIMATKDLRFFDDPGAETLPDGHARRGMSVVAALSEWLVHTNRRANGAWSQRYEHGIPVTGLEPLAGGGGTGTTVRFLAGAQLAPLAEDFGRFAEAWPGLAVDVDDRRGGRASAAGAER
ncbi:ATP-binding protein [Nonomuraea soli]|uniref:DNA topoisomerase (ATP-hydrolyzing) n=1 Tax=Nonomuraea soli TaxID=1032476 RepID=A0A7W0CCU0_9ACTN|nr:ATP-binding protein [Nonomuraea soli]MBA2888781.1 DNA gyrase subunit B [Nonomuraea soli]